MLFAGKHPSMLLVIMVLTDAHVNAMKIKTLRSSNSINFTGLKIFSLALSSSGAFLSSEYVIWTAKQHPVQKRDYHIIKIMAGKPVFYIDFNMPDNFRDADAYAMDGRCWKLLRAFFDMLSLKRFASHTITIAAVSLSHVNHRISAQQMFFVATTAAISAMQ